jgi:hypothetical protein
MVSFDTFDAERVPSVKLAVHTLQIVLAFVAWCMEIAVFVNDEATITGQIGWTFAVVSVNPVFFIFVFVYPVALFSTWAWMARL